MFITCALIFTLDTYLPLFLISAQAQPFTVRFSSDNFEGLYGKNQIKFFIYNSFTLTWNLVYWNNHTRLEPVGRVAKMNWLNYENSCNLWCNNCCSSEICRVVVFVSLYENRQYYPARSWVIVACSQYVVGLNDQHCSSSWAYAKREEQCWAWRPTTYCEQATMTQDQAE